MTTTTNPKDDAAIRELVSRFHHSLDERVLDDAWATQFLSEDVRFATPAGTDRGRAAVHAQTRRGILQFARTVHLGTNLLIYADGDSATVRWNALNTHVHREPLEGELFVSAGVYSGQVVREGYTWRFAELELEVVWTQGTPPPA